MNFNILPYVETGFKHPATISSTSATERGKAAMIATLCRFVSEGRSCASGRHVDLNPGRGNKRSPVRNTLG